MIAGGTGIAPCYQIVKASLENPKDSVIINMIYSNSTFDDVLLKDELIELSKLHADRFKLHFTVTQIKDNIPEGWSANRIDEQMIKQHLVKPSMTDASNYVLVCGPPGMMDKGKEILNSLNYNYKTMLGAPNKYPLAPTNWVGRLWRYNPFIIMWAVCFFIMAIIWSYSRGKIGFDGKFCVEGFKNEKGLTRYAYRLVNDPKFATLGDPPAECITDGIWGEIISWVLYVPH
jgi:hypothetical protein